MPVGSWSHRTPSLPEPSRVTPWGLLGGHSRFRIPFGGSSLIRLGLERRPRFIDTQRHPLHRNTLNEGSVERLDDVSENLVLLHRLFSHLIGLEHALQGVDRCPLR